MSLVEIHNLEKKYYKTKRYREILLKPFKKEYIHALHNVSLTVEKGSILGLLGPNGAGKTTLIKILATLVTPTSGTVIVKGLDIVRDSLKIRQCIGFVTSDERSFYWRLTGIQNLEFFASLNNIPLTERTHRIKTVLEQTELSNAENMMFKDYSTGMKQRLAIARGLLCNPEILLLDEPTRSLDPYSASNMRTFITDKIIKEFGHTVIIATHNLYEAYELCSHIAVMNEGRVVCNSTKETLLQETLLNTYTITLSAESPQVKWELINEVQEYRIFNDTGINKYSIITNNIESVLQSVYSSGASITECTREKVSFDEFFINLIRREKGQTEQ